MFTTSNEDENAHKNLMALPAQFQSNNMFTWANAMPQPLGRPTPQKEQIKNILFAAAGAEYKGDWDPELQQFIISDPRFRGASVIEVAITRLADRAAAGDSRAITELLDRTIDKPRQGIDSTNITGSYSDFLEALAEQTSPTRTPNLIPHGKYNTKTPDSVFDVHFSQTITPEDYEEDLNDV